MTAPMHVLVDRFTRRVLPAVITAVGVALIAGGLLTYTNATDPVDASPEPTEIIRLSPSPSSEPASPGPSGSDGNEASPSPSAIPADRVATRVVVPALRIDLPVVKQPGGANSYPLCDVAMYIQELSQPGRPGATYLYAHARTGMFLPILDASTKNNGARMLGMLVQVYTNDNRVFLYEITEVRRHITSLDDAVDETDETLWLQTSEGPKGTPGKTQVIARPLSDLPADPRDANPKPRPVVCG